MWGYAVEEVGGNWRLEHHLNIVYFLFFSTHMRYNDVCTCKKYQKCIIWLLFFCTRVLPSFLPPECVSCVYFKCWHSFLSNFLYIFILFTAWVKRWKITINFNFKVHEFYFFWISKDIFLLFCILFLLCAKWKVI